LALGIATTLNFAGLQEEEAIEWTAESKLTWKDFKGKAPSNVRAAATTASGISYEFSTRFEGNEMMVDYTVLTFFYPTKSWYKPKICNDLTLVHEQLHFDISELFARKMRKQMDSVVFTNNVKAEVKKIYKKILNELSDYQNRYDRGTDFSRDKEQQLLWNKKIREELKK
jgi:hypothetical protein